MRVREGECEAFCGGRVVGRQQSDGGEHVVGVDDDPRVLRELPAAGQVGAGAAGQHALGDTRAAVAQRAAGEHDEVDLAQVDAGPLDHPTFGADDHLGAAGVTAQRQPGGGAGELLVVVTVGVGGGQERRVGGADSGGGGEVGPVGGV